MTFNLESSFKVEIGFTKVNNFDATVLKTSNRLRLNMIVMKFQCVNVNKKLSIFQYVQWQYFEIISYILPINYNPTSNRYKA